MAVTVTVAGFREEYSEFSDTSDTDVQKWLDRALLLHSVNEDCVYALCAHLLTLEDEPFEDQVGGSGEITSVQTGPRWTQYMTQAKENREVWFSRTRYGRFYLAMSRRLPKRAFPVRAY